MRGYVTKISSKSGTSKQGRSWTKYSFITEDEKGNESGWITYGFEKPLFSENDFIEYEVQEINGFKDYKKGSGKIVSNPPARRGAKSSAGVGSGPVSAGVGAETNSAGAAQADRQTQIVLQHSQEMAVSLVGILLAQDALPVSKGANRGGQAKRFNEIVAAVDTFTVKFHNDVATGRLLEHVADMGIVDTTPDAPIPEAGSTEQKTSTESGYY